MLNSAEFQKWQSLETDYNAVLDLIQAGSLDQAEVTARDLLVRFPDLPEGHECLGVINKARGDHQRAAEHYRQALHIVRAHPGDFEPQREPAFNA
jgi:Tfp pilus assembly protein PilF